MAIYSVFFSILAHSALKHLIAVNLGFLLRFCAFGLFDYEFWNICVVLISETARQTWRGPSILDLLPPLRKTPSRGCWRFVLKIIDETEVVPVMHFTLSSQVFPFPFQWCTLLTKLYFLFLSRVISNWPVSSSPMESKVTWSTVLVGRTTTRGCVYATAYCVGKYFNCIVVKNNQIIQIGRMSDVVLHSLVCSLTPELVGKWFNCYCWSF